MRERGLGVREVNFAGDIGSLAARPVQAIGSDFFMLSARLSRSFRIGPIVRVEGVAEVFK